MTHQILRRTTTALLHLSGKPNPTVGTAACRSVETWRHGPNATPGIGPNTPNLTPVLLAHLPFTPDSNWIYIQPLPPGQLGWVNVTLPDTPESLLLFWDCDKNEVITASSGTYLLTLGTGNTPRWFRNDGLGTAFSQASQLEAIAAFYGAPRSVLGAREPAVR